MSDDEDTYVIPLRDQRVFGAGVKRKRINFVPPAPDTDEPTRSRVSSSVADRYLSTVIQQETVALALPNDAPIERSASFPEPRGDTSQQTFEDSLKESEKLCEICKLPMTDPPPDPRGGSLTTSHATSIAHQVCLKHSRPPSHLDRDRLGLQYLAAYGWDPNARNGLGTTSQGIAAPIKAVQKNDTLGIGILFDRAKTRKVVKPKKLNAKEAREMDDQSRRKGQRLQELFYANDDLQRYL